MTDRPKRDSRGLVETFSAIQQLGVTTWTRTGSRREYSACLRSQISRLRYDSLLEPNCGRSPHFPRNLPQPRSFAHPLVKLVMSWRAQTSGTFFGSHEKNA